MAKKPTDETVEELIETFAKSKVEQSAEHLGDLDTYLFSEGRHQRLWQAFGAHIVDTETSKGVHFGVWAPNATQVSVVGNFNGWNSDSHIMQPNGQSGIWDIFIPNIGEGEDYNLTCMISTAINSRKKQIHLGLAPNTDQKLHRLCAS
jgi:hypothetical protein